LLFNIRYLLNSLWAILNKNNFKQIPFLDRLVDACNDAWHDEPPARAVFTQGLPELLFYRDALAMAAPGSHPLLGLVDILTPNETELARLTGMRATHDDDRTVTAARALLGRGVGRVIVTLGERGALSVGPEGSTRVPPFPVETRDPTGAGDAFAAAVVVGLASDLPLAGALRLGTRAGAFCAKRLGVLDGLPTVEALDREVPDPPA
jgi:sugar/nucleoside kinase (ribokinase family)